ncbi:hypothetical protein P7K49_016999 [Saguinus oedipus]|uniref:Uncharacterized protein n=1 Tax=Saguinus oedipus TaxID=9490 RepID=A0ABQ9V182_SAGOE|nr:hypothetical protein P7K49_016999 [Saguinus oedipus]
MERFSAEWSSGELRLINHEVQRLWFLEQAVLETVLQSEMEGKTPALPFAALLEEEASAGAELVCPGVNQGEPGQPTLCPSSWAVYSSMGLKSVYSKRRMSGFRHWFHRLHFHKGNYRRITKYWPFKDIPGKSVVGLISSLEELNLNKEEPEGTEDIDHPIFSDASHKQHPGQHGALRLSSLTYRQ